MRSIFWKSYALVKCGLFLRGLASGLPTGWELLVYVFLAVGHLGLLGYAFNLRLIARWLWKLYFLVLVFGAAMAAAVTLFYASHPAGLLQWPLLLILALLAPFVYGLWDYAFGRRGCWQAAAAKERSDE